jgi:Na+/proline symporter
LDGQGLFVFSLPVALTLLLGFYGATFVLSTVVNRKNENTDAYMISNHNVGFGISAASMSATWIWAASFYAAASSGYTYGLSGPVHYGLWGALMILFIYPFGLRFRQLAPKAHTLSEVMHARHGSSSQLIMVVSNILGSGVSLTANFTAAGALVSILSPMSFQTGVLIAGVGVLSYTLWSGFRASILTDFAQVVGMILISVIVITWVLITAGGPGTFVNNLSTVTPEQANLFSTTAILEQGAPFFVAILAYAIGNQTIAQRLFAVRQDQIKPTFITASVGYGGVVTGLGMIGMMALLLGVKPVDGNLNNIIPQMASGYLPPVIIGLVFILIIASLSSTADSDLSALSALIMTDVYGKNLARDNPNSQTMLLIGRITMIVATVAGLIFASLSFDILIMLVFVGALWGAIVFPVIISCYWTRVTNAAFTWSVLVALVLFVLVRFELIPLSGALGLPFEIIAAVGGGVVIGLMSFAFLGRIVGIVVGVIAALVCVYFFTGFMRDYTVLMGSLISFGASTILCIVITLIKPRTPEFDFSLIGQRVRNFQQEAEPAPTSTENTSTNE